MLKCSFDAAVNWNQNRNDLITRKYNEIKTATLLVKAN